jgi:hypothetical protein
LIGNPIVIDGIPLPSDAPLFLAFVATHLAAGLIAVITGAVAMLSRKRAGRHPQAGTIYYWALSVVFVTMTILAISQWTEDYHLFILGALSFAAATIGRTARRKLWPSWAHSYDRNGFVLHPHDNRLLCGQRAEPALVARIASDRILDFADVDRSAHLVQRAVETPARQAAKFKLTHYRPFGSIVPPNPSV